MHRLAHNGVDVGLIAQAALKAIDRALLAHIRLFVAAIEATGGSNLPAAVTEDLFIRILAHCSELVEDREDVRQLFDQLTAIEEDGNQHEIGARCPSAVPRACVGTDLAAAPSP